MRVEGGQRKDERKTKEGQRRDKGGLKEGKTKEVGHRKRGQRKENKGSPFPKHTCTSLPFRWAMVNFA